VWLSAETAQLEEIDQPCILAHPWEHAGMLRACCRLPIPTVVRQGQLCTTAA